MIQDKVVRMFIGYDQIESGAYYTYEHSIHSRSSMPVSITPLRLSQLKSMFNRSWDAKQTNEFSFSRWLVPYLCGYQGWAIFTDCDMLCRDDIAELWALRDKQYSVMCIKHSHKPKESVKYLGLPQSSYEKKNWSSVMLFNCSKCTELTRDYVNTATGLQLHQFKWLEGDHLIGELPHEWNHLVGYDEINPEAKIAHFTTGGPYFRGYENVEFADEWFEESDKMNYCKENTHKPTLLSDKSK